VDFKGTALQPTRRTFVCEHLTVKPQSIQPNQLNEKNLSPHLKDILFGLLMETFIHTRADKISWNLIYKPTDHLRPVIEKLWSQHILMPGLNINLSNTSVSA
jgi:hypothetical protein